MTSDYFHTISIYLSYFGGRGRRGGRHPTISPNISNKRNMKITWNLQNCGIFVYIDTGIMSHFCLFPKRLSQDSYPMIARTTMLDKRTLQRAFDHCQGPHSFLLVTNVNDGRPRLRVDGYREVPAYL